ncbi:Uncharacterized protein DAT39_015605, partial [Clarias magur]
SLHSRRVRPADVRARLEPQEGAVLPRSQEGGSVHRRGSFGTSARGLPAEVWT